MLVMKIIKSKLNNAQERWLVLIKPIKMYEDYVLLTGVLLSAILIRYSNIIWLCMLPALVAGILSLFTKKESKYELIRGNIVDSVAVCLLCLAFIISGKITPESLFTLAVLYLIYYISSTINNEWWRLRVFALLCMFVAVLNSYLYGLVAAMFYIIIRLTIKKSPTKLKWRIDKK
jgi:hypothetical protein